MLAVAGVQSSSQYLGPYLVVRGSHTAPAGMTISKPPTLYVPPLGESSRVPSRVRSLPPLVRDSEGELDALSELALRFGATTASWHPAANTVTAPTQRSSVLRRIVVV